MSVALGHSVKTTSIARMPRCDHSADEGRRKIHSACPPGSGPKTSQSTGRVRPSMSICSAGLVRKERDIELSERRGAGEQDGGSPLRETDAHHSIEGCAGDECAGADDFAFVVQNLGSEVGVSRARR